MSPLEEWRILVAQKTFLQPGQKMIYQSSSIRAFCLVLTCAIFLTIEAAPHRGQLVQLHPISRAQYESLLEGRSVAVKPAVDNARHINYTITNPLDGWTNDISHGWRYLLNKTGLYQKPEKPVVRVRGYKLCYVNPIYGGPNAGEVVSARSTRAAAAEQRVAINIEEAEETENNDDDAFDAHGKPIAVNYFPSPGITCVWVRPEPEPNEEEDEVVAHDVGVASVQQYYPSPAGAYPYAGYPSAGSYASAYGAYPYAAASTYASPYGSPYATPYAYGRSNAKSHQKTAPNVAVVHRQPVNSIKATVKSKVPQKKTQPQQQPQQQSRQYGTYGYSSPYSPYGASYGSPYAGYYGGLYNGGYGSGFGNAYGSPYNGLNPYSGIYGGQPFGYPGFGHYDTEGSGEDSADSDDSGEAEGEDDETFDHDQESAYSGEEEEDDE